MKCAAGVLALLLLLASCAPQRAQFSRERLDQELRALEPTQQEALPSLDEIQALQVPPLPRATRAPDDDLYRCVERAVRFAEDAPEICADLVARSTDGIKRAAAAAVLVELNALDPKVAARFPALSCRRQKVDPVACADAVSLLGTPAVALKGGELRFTGRGRVAVIVRGEGEARVSVDGALGNARSGARITRADFFLDDGVHTLAIAGRSGVSVELIPVGARAEVALAIDASRPGRGTARAVDAPPVVEARELSEALAHQVLLDSGLTGDRVHARAHRDQLLATYGGDDVVLAWAARHSERSRVQRALYRRLVDFPRAPRALLRSMASRPLEVRLARLRSLATEASADLRARQFNLALVEVATTMGRVDLARAAREKIEGPYSPAERDLFEELARASHDYSQLAPNDPTPLARDWDALALNDHVAYLGALRAALDDEPGSRVLHVRLANADAAHLQVALERFPYDWELLQIAKAQGARLPWSEALEIGDKILSEAPVELDPDLIEGQAIVVEREVAERFVSESGHLLVEHLIVRLLDDRAADALGALSVPVERELIRCRVVDEAGVSRAATRPVGVSDLLMPKLKAGDRVEVLTVSVAASGEPFAFEARALRTSAPAKERGYIVRGLARGDVHRAGEPTSIGEESRAFARDVRALPREAFAADNLTRSDAVAVRATRPKATREGPEAPLDPWLTRAAREIAGEGGARERFARLFRFVARRVAHDDDGARESGEILQSGRGARHRLLTDLARAAGLDVREVELRPPTSFPTWASERPARVMVLTTAFSSVPALFSSGLELIGGLPPALARWEQIDGPRARPLPSSWISDRPVVARVIGTVTPVELDAFVALELPAWAATRARATLLRADDAERERLMTRALQGSFPGLQIEELQIRGLRASGAPLGIGIALKAPLDVSAGRAVISPLFEDGIGAAFGLALGPRDLQAPPARESDLELPGHRERLELVLRIDDGARVAEQPSAIDAKAGPIAIEQRVAQTDGALRLVREFVVDAARVQRGAWPSFARTLSSARAKVAAPIEVFAAPLSARPRAERPKKKCVSVGHDQRAEAPHRCPHLGRGRARDERRRALHRQDGQRARSHRARG